MGLSILSAGFPLAACEEVHYKCLSHDPLNQTAGTRRISHSNTSRQSRLMNHLLIRSSRVRAQRVSLYLGARCRKFIIRSPNSDGKKGSRAYKEATDDRRRVLVSLSNPSSSGTASSSEEQPSGSPCYARGGYLHGWLQRCEMQMTQEKILSFS